MKAIQHRLIQMNAFYCVKRLTYNPYLVIDVLLSTMASCCRH